jgi:hypothetical protein
MKKWLLILSLFIFPVVAVLAQQDDPDEPEVGKVQQRMQEYIETKLNLNKEEAGKFRPIFIRYLREFAQARRENRLNPDKLKFQGKIIEMRLRYRAEFRQVLVEQKADNVFKQEDIFRKEMLRIMKESRGNPGRPIKPRSGKAIFQQGIE